MKNKKIILSIVVLIQLSIMTSCRSYKNLYTTTPTENSSLSHFFEDLNEYSIERKLEGIPKSVIREISEKYYGYKVKNIAERDNDILFYESNLQLIFYGEKDDYWILALKSKGGGVMNHQWFFKEKNDDGLLYISESFVETIEEFNNCFNTQKCLITTSKVIISEEVFQNKNK